MGQWLCRFLASRGHKIRIYDFGENLMFPVEKDLDKGVADAEIIIISTPISVTKDVLSDLIKRSPKALMFDIASIKTPIISILEEAALNGIIDLLGPSDVRARGRVHNRPERRGVQLWEPGCGRSGKGPDGRSEHHGDGRRGARSCDGICSRSKPMRSI